MYPFSKKNTFSLSDILKGIQQAVSSSVAMLQAQQVNNLSRFWMKGGQPVTQKVQVGNREVDVPLFTLVPHSNLEMEDVEIKFKARIGDVIPDRIENVGADNQPVTHADLQMSLQTGRIHPKDVMEITVRFKIKDTPEGVSRLLDEYNKHL